MTLRGGSNNSDVQGGESQKIHDMFGISEEKMKYMDQMMDSLDDFIVNKTEVEIVKEYYNAGGPNVIIMSDAAKPIYCRYGKNEEDYTNVCSLIQAIRASMKDDESIRGDLQYLEVVDDEYDGVMKVAFVSIGAMTLVAISNSDWETECYLRLTLEYVYGQIIFTLTDHVQKAFQRSPNLDIRNMLGSTTNLIIDGLLDSSGPMGNGGPFLLASVETVCPIPFPVRNYASLVLLSVCEGDDNNHHNKKNKKKDDSNDKNNDEEDKKSIVDSTLFALLIMGKKLITIVQPKSPKYHLHTSDINLIMNYVHCQPGVLSNESWFPICLPRLNSSGFVHAFATCLDTDTNMSVVLISQDNSTEQFELFRAATLKIRKRLGLPTPKDSQILRVTTNSTNTNTSSPIPVLNTLSFQDNNNMNDSQMSNENTNNDTDGIHNSIIESSNDYNENVINEEEKEDGSKEGDATNKSQSNTSSESQENNDASKNSRSSPTQSSSHIAIQGTTPKQNLRRKGNHNVLSQNKKKETSTDDEDKYVAKYNLKEAIQKTLPLETQKELIDTYCKIAKAMHFVFRCDVCVQNHETGAETGGILSQCLSPPLEFPFIDGYSKRRVWSMYQRLSLRLRLGSASTESTIDVFDVIMDTPALEEKGIGANCPGQRLMETPPNVHGVSYILDANELFVALNGKDFELYATLPATVPPKTGTMLCARLVRRIWADEGKLFLACPLSWRV